MQARATSDLLCLDYFRKANMLVSRLDLKLDRSIRRSLDHRRPSEIVAHPGMDYILFLDGTRVTYRRYPTERTLAVERDEGYIWYDVDVRRLDVKTPESSRRIELMNFGQLYTPYSTGKSLDRVFRTFSLDPFIVMAKE